MTPRRHREGLRSRLVMVAGLLGFTAVAIGAFAAHGLRARLPVAALELIHTGARYQIYHALALLAMAAWPWPMGRLAQLSGWLFGAGVVIFSGSLYLLALTGMRWLGLLTPFGGICLLSGWLLLVAAAWRAGRGPAE